MGRRNQHSRAELKDMALRAAAEIVEAQGSAALGMREVARRIGYTVGSMYMIFTNLDDLIVHLNEQTVTELQRSLEQVANKSHDPAHRLRLMSAAYLGFALLHTHRWRLVFEHRLPVGQKAPASYRGHTEAIFALVRDALEQLQASNPPGATETLATALWSGVHGICMLAVTGKLQVGGRASVQALIDVLLDRLLHADGATPSRQ
ncbi:MAG: TetR/AcrR family transcriptional regulator [Steroidobacteraceae bacterium]